MKRPEDLLRWFDNPTRRVAALAGAIGFLLTTGLSDIGDHYYESAIIHPCPSNWPTPDTRTSTGEYANIQYDILDFEAMLDWNDVPAPGLGNRAVEAGQMSPAQLQAAELILKPVKVPLDQSPAMPSAEQTAYLITGSTNLSRRNQAFCSTGFLGTGSIYFTPAAVEGEAAMAKAGIEVSALPDLNKQIESPSDTPGPTVLAAAYNTIQSN